MIVQTQAFQERLRAEARIKRYPLWCTFELTPTCNLRCHFCYVALDPYKGPYLSTAECKAVLDKLEQAGVLWLTLTGGEIFSRRDFPEIYRYAKRKGFLLTLFTNATMVNERIATLLRDDPPYSVEVSIYGADAEHYEGTTGIPGSFARFERGVRLLMEAGAPLLLKTPLSTLTQHHVPALMAWCEQRGLPYKMGMALDARHDGGQEPTLYRIKPRAVKALRAEIGELQGPRAVHAECSSERLDRANELYQCNAGRLGFFVDALGSASHCLIEREPAYPMLGMEWNDIWQQMGEWVTQPLPADAPCSGCSMRGSCSNCPARSRLATGSSYLKDPYMCDTTHEAHGLPPADHSKLMRREVGSCLA